MPSQLHVVKVNFLVYAMMFQTLETPWVVFQQCSPNSASPKVGKWREWVQHESSPDSREQDKCHIVLVSPRFHLKPGLWLSFNKSVNEGEKKAGEKRGKTRRPMDRRDYIIDQLSPTF